MECIQIQTTAVPCGAAFLEVTSYNGRASNVKRERIASSFEVSGLNWTCIYIVYFLILPLTQLYRRIIGRRMFDELKIKKDMEWKPTDVTILFVCCWISTCFGPTGPSSGEFVVRVENSHQDRPQHTEHVNIAAQKLNQWLCEQLYELSWIWACGLETCRDPAIYE